MDRHVLRSTFTTVAELYARARPRYPSELFDDLIELAGLRQGARVLEIGPGTGQATRPMAERGFLITAVEIGLDMAAVARRELAEFANVEVVTAAFEGWPLPDDKFDLVMAATAFHWIEREHAEPKVAAALKPGRALAVIHNEHVAGGTAAFFDQVQRCYEQYMPSTPPGLQCPMAADTATLVADIAGTGLFEPAVVRAYGFDIDYTTSEYLDLLRTYSGHISLDQENQTHLFECIAGLIDGSFGGRITKHYEATLVLAKRQAGNVEIGATSPT
jgi:SAM-dependent methyltransferase